MQGKAYQLVCVVSHEQWDIKHIIIQFQVIKREPYTEVHLIRELFLELFKTSAFGVCFRFYLNWEDVVLPLNQKIYLIVRIVLTPISGSNISLRVEMCNAFLWGNL